MDYDPLSVMRRIEDVNKIREELGTKPRELEEKPTVYYRGGEAVSVKMVIPNADWINDSGIIGSRPNYYAGMFVMAVQTWGGPLDSGITKWNNATPEARRFAVQAILERQALPLALEHPQFLFEITGCSRSAFDQIARARIGVTFSSMGTRDNAHGDFAVVVPPHVYDNPPLFAAFKRSVEESKRQYVSLLKAGRSWQDARAVLPQSMVHRFCMNINYAALSTFMSKRLMFEEQYDTVAVAWAMRKELSKYYAMLAEPLRPACDLARRCVYHKANTANEAFSCLFKGCDRWPESTPYEMADFAEHSTEEADIEEWTAQKIPAPTDPPNWGAAYAKDLPFFTTDLK